MTSAGTDRIVAIDLIRGVAVMGILLLNIVAFAMPSTASFNPRAYGGASGADLWAYILVFILFDGKMRGLFAMLFGASMLIVVDRAEQAGRSPVAVHYARMVWLLVFGLVHLWLVWFGDILVLYALIGMAAYAFRHDGPARLIGIGVLLILFQMIVGSQFPLGVMAVQEQLALPGPPAEAATALTAWNRAFGMPDAAWVQGQLALFRSSYAHIVAARFAETIWWPLTLTYQAGAETLAFMLFGMAAWRSGLLTDAAPRRHLLRWTAAGFGIGIPATAGLAAWLIASNFALLPVTAVDTVIAVPLRPLMAVAWACLILLLVRSGSWWGERMAAAGRMAFTNYLVTSLICTALFYGYGGGLYGYLSRAELYLVVIGMWALMLLWSKPWLDRFRFGPFEWLWRSLARGQRQPLLKHANPSH